MAGNRLFKSKLVDDFALGRDDLGRLGSLPARIGDTEAMVKAGVHTVEALKAAGFEPGHGELKIGREHPFRPPLFSEGASTYRSPALMCAEVV